MALGQKETESILSFCATGTQAHVFAENGRCVIILTSEGQGKRFEGSTFEESLKVAADGGLLRRACIEKQIAFWSRHTERPKDAISRVLMAELGPARGRIVEREIVARVGRPLSQLTPTEMDDVSSAAEVVLGMSMNAGEAARMAKRVLTEARGALAGPPATPTTLFELAKRIARLVHETQRERGETAVLLGSDGQRFAAELAEQRAQTDRWIADLAAFATAATGLPDAVLSRMSLLQDLAGAVAAPRAAADGGATSPNGVIDAYNDLNARLLEIIDAIAGDAPERLRVLGVAFASLMWAKEHTGRERAQLAVAFGRDRFAPGQIFTVGALFGAQESFLRLFATVAPPDIVAELRERLAEPRLDEVQRLEAIALSHAEGGFGVDPTHWFDAITRKVDAIGEVGGELSALIAKRAGEP